MHIFSNDRIFDGKQFTVLFSTWTPFKEKSKFTNSIKDKGGTVAFIVTKRVNYVVVDSRIDCDNFKIKQAIRIGIPVVSFDFVTKCLESSSLLDTDEFLVFGETKSQQLQNGIMQLDNVPVPAVKLNQVDLSKIREWRPSDELVPHDYDAGEVLKYSFLIQESKSSAFVSINSKAKSTSHSKNLALLVLEILRFSDEDDGKRYRVKSFKLRASSHGECPFVDEVHQLCESAELSLRLYSHLLTKLEADRYRPIEVTEAPVQTVLDYMTPPLRLVIEERLVAISEELSPEVEQLVESIWAESVGELNNMLTVPLSSIKLSQIDEAESVLLQIRDSGENDLLSLVNQYKSLIPITHPPLDSKFYSSNIDENEKKRTLIKWLAKEEAICRIIRDSVSVTEATNWCTKTSTLAKYRALGCHIRHVDPQSSKFGYISELFNNSSDKNDPVELVNIYALTRASEIEQMFEFDEISDNFVRNRQSLFHATSPENVAGILFRGLLPPRIAQSLSGVDRSDEGNLGLGIYFADQSKVSSRYSKLNQSKSIKHPNNHVRNMFLCSVELGKIFETSKQRLDLKEPPKGYLSVKGVANTNESPSFFKHDEYAIYSAKQQRLEYLIQFRFASDLTDHPLQLEQLSLQKELVNDQFDEIEVRESPEILNELPPPLADVKYGLTSTGTEVIPLTEVHVRAKLVDLASQVVVMQCYKNPCNYPIEAKYVFPLEDSAAVCGFEAFINDKHIKGVVKEKETAHREYKEAVEKGHGAYLMDQDEESPEVFTISVGNLPPNATVIIKISLVAELLIDEDYISWRLPGAVASWKQREALETTTQKTTSTYGTSVENSKLESFTLQISVDMPYEIREIKSTTHNLKIKQTDCRAVLEPEFPKDIIGLKDEGFHLLIMLSQLHAARIWVEEPPDLSDEESRLSNTSNKMADQTAAMLVFYPQLECHPSSSNQMSARLSQSTNQIVTILLDCSNSMMKSGKGFGSAKLIANLILNELPKGCLFNLVKYGSYFDELFCMPQIVNEKNKISAKTFIKQAECDMGSTNAHLPLFVLHQLTDHWNNHAVFLISDGYLGGSGGASDDKLFSLVKQASGTHFRVFTCGVGTVCNKFMLQKLALLGQGTFQYFDHKMRSKWSSKISDQLSKSQQPNLSELQVDWMQYEEDEPDSRKSKIVQAPAKIVSVFNGDRLVVYSLLPRCNQATLSAKLGDREISTTVYCSPQSKSQGKIVRCLAANAIIKDWEHGLLSDNILDHEIQRRAKKSDIIGLSCAMSVISPFTSFVAIEERSESEQLEFRDSTTLHVAMKKCLHTLLNQEDVDSLSYLGWSKEAVDEDKPSIDYDKDNWQTLYKFDESSKDDIQDMLDTVRGFQYSQSECAVYLYRRLFNAIRQICSARDVLSLAIIYNVKYFYEDISNKAEYSDHVKEQLKELNAEMIEYKRAFQPQVGKPAPAFLSVSSTETDELSSDLDSYGNEPSSLKTLDSCTKQKIGESCEAADNEDEDNDYWINDALDIDDEDSEDEDSEDEMGFGLFDDDFYVECAMKKRSTPDPPQKRDTPRIQSSEEQVAESLDVAFVDSGTKFTRGGLLAANSVNIVELETAIGQPRHQGVMVGMGQKDFYAGKEISPSLRHLGKVRRIREMTSEEPLGAVVCEGRDTPLSFLEGLTEQTVDHFERASSKSPTLRSSQVSNERELVLSGGLEIFEQKGKPPKYGQYDYPPERTMKKKVHGGISTQPEIAAQLQRSICLEDVNFMKKPAPKEAPVSDIPAAQKSATEVETLAAVDYVKGSLPISLAISSANVETSFVPPPPPPPPPQSSQQVETAATLESIIPRGTVMTAARARSRRGAKQAEFMDKLPLLEHSFKTQESSFQILGKETDTFSQVSDIPDSEKSATEVETAAAADHVIEKFHEHSYRLSSSKMERSPPGPPPPPPPQLASALPVKTLSSHARHVARPPSVFAGFKRCSARWQYSPASGGKMRENFEEIMKRSKEKGRKENIVAESLNKSKGAYPMEETTPQDGKKIFVGEPKFSIFTQTILSGIHLSEDELFKHQDSNDGSWKFNREVCRQFLIDYDKLLNVMNEAGIYSFGTTIAGELLNALITAIILAVLDILREFFLTTLKFGRMKSIAESYVNKIFKEKFPLTCYQMQLADSWEEFVKKLIRESKISYVPN